MVASEEWVEVLVPQHLVPDVYGLIAEKMAGEPKGKGSTANGELFERMFLESPPAMRKLLLLLAHNAGRSVSAGEIADELGLSRAQLAGVLGAFGRRKKNRYKGAQAPFTARWDHEQGAWLYRMDAEAAQVIKRAAQEMEEV